MPKKSTNLQYMDGVNIKYESYCDPEGDYDGYGRNSVITKSWVEITNIYNFIKDLRGAMCRSSANTPILVYCFDRLCHIYDIYNTDNYEINVRGGYYGQEIDSVYLKSEIDIAEKFEIIKNCYNTDADRIKYLLTLEYGYALERLSDLNTINIKIVSIDDVAFPAAYYFRKLSSNNNHNADIYNNNYTLPRAICTKNKDKYEIVDGYHRICAAMKNGNKSVKIIVITE